MINEPLGDSVDGVLMLVSVKQMGRKRKQTPHSEKEPFKKVLFLSPHRLWYLN